MGDNVLDAGGLLREWIHLISEEMFDPSVGLFLRANTDELTYKISHSK